MEKSLSTDQKRGRLGKRAAPTAALSGVVLLATWMGYAYGGYFTTEWAPAALLLAVLSLVLAMAGILRGIGSGPSAVALGLFAGYGAWTFASLLWSPNRGDAWTGSGQTLLYVLVFGVTVAFLALGASRRWVLAASALGPAVVAAFTLRGLSLDPGTFLKDDRLNGTVGYYNGEAAFLLVSFWVAIYVGGSRQMNPLLRGLALAGATLSLEVSTLAQSRGALVAMALSMAVFFLLSGQRLRGLLSLAPVAAALMLTFQDLNAVYLASSGAGDPSSAVAKVVPMVWVSAVGAGFYGLIWGVIDRAWRPPALLVRAFGGAVLVVLAVALAFGLGSHQDQVGSDPVGDPVEWTAQKWEAFKTNDTSGQEQSRYLSASGTGRYALWEVAWKDFASRPILGVGTHNYEATYYRLRDEPVGYVRQPHMLPLEVLAERGVIGGVLFFGFLGTCVVVGLRNRFGQLGAEGKAMVGATIAAIAYWFVHSSAEWFWQMPAVTLPAIVYLAMLVTPWRRGFGGGKPRWTMRAGLAAAAVLAILAVTPLYAAQLYLDRSEAESNPWLAIQLVERAQQYNPVDPRLPQREAELRAQIGDWPKAIEAHERAIRLNPEHYAPKVLLARFYEDHGKPQRALPLYKESSNLNPLDDDLREHARALEEGAG